LEAVSTRQGHSSFDALSQAERKAIAIDFLECFQPPTENWENSEQPSGNSVVCSPGNRVSPLIDFCGRVRYLDPSAKRRAVSEIVSDIIGIITTVSQMMPTPVDPDYFSLRLSAKVQTAALNLALNNVNSVKADLVTYATHVTLMHHSSAELNPVLWNRLKTSCEEGE
jgi:hypothetical protein